MAVSVKKVTLWRGKVANRPGALAETLEPLAAAKADLQILMGYREPGEKLEAVVELWPVSGRKMSDGAAKAGLTPSTIPTLLVTGDNRPGLGHAIARGLSDAGVNIGFLVAQVMGRRYSAVFGFETDGDAERAAAAIKKAARPRGRR